MVAAAAAAMLVVAGPGAGPDRAHADTPLLEAWVTSDCAYASSTAECDPGLAWLQLTNETPADVLFTIDGPDGPTEVVAPPGGTAVELRLQPSATVEYAITAEGLDPITWTLTDRCAAGGCAAGRTFQLSWARSPGGGFLAWDVAADGTISQNAAGLATKVARDAGPRARLTGDCDADSVEVHLAYPVAADAPTVFEVGVDGQATEELVGPQQTVTYTLGGVEVVEVRHGETDLARWSRAESCTEVLGVQDERPAPDAAPPPPPAPPAILPVTGSPTGSLAALAAALIGLGSLARRSGHSGRT